MWQQLALAVAALSGLWTLFLLVFGGVTFTVLGVRVRSNDWTDAATVCIISLLVVAWGRWRASGATAAGLSRSLSAPVAAWFRAPENVLLLAILVVAAVARYWAITFGLPHPSARPDEDAISSMAGSYFHGNPEQTIFTYPPLFMLVVAAAFWVIFQWWPSILSRLNLGTGPYEPSTAAVRTVQRVLSAAAGVASVWLVFRIALRLFDRTTALVSAAFLALAFLHARDSHFGVTDVPMTFMVLVAFLAIVKLSQSGSTRDLIAAAVLTGLATGTKYNAALLVAPAAFAILIEPQKRLLAARALRVVGFGVVLVAAFLAVCPYAVVNRAEFVRDVSGVSSHLAVGHGPDLGRGWVHHLTVTLRYGLGLPLLAAGIVGLFAMVWREGRKGLLVALFPIAYYAVSGSGRTVFARHALPLVPFLCLTAGYLVVTLATALSSALRRPAWRAPVVTAMAALALLPSAMSVIAFNRLIAGEDSRVLARRWIEARFAPGSTILQIGQVNGHAYMDYETGYILSREPSSLRPTLVVLVTSPLWAPNIDDVAPWVTRDYDLRFVQQAVAEDEPRNIYDRQDEFFVPLAGFHRIERPGPNLKVYVRRDVAIGLK